MLPDGWTPDDEIIAEHLRRAQEEAIRDYQEKQRAWNEFVAGWRVEPEEIRLPGRKRPAELDDADRKSPWGYLPWHG